MIAARTTLRIRWARVAGLLVLLTALAVLAGHRPTLSRSTAAPSATAAAGLDPDLAAALRRARAAAADDGVRLIVDSGWRSPQHQEQLLQEAIVTYGSRAEAARWVATPETSEHVKGRAVDMAAAAAAWLAEHGAAHGLCRVYDNEPWHYELRPRAVAHGCPPTYADPTHDPRMHHG